MEDKRIIYKFSTYEERIAYWQIAREVYDEWRRTDEAKKFIAYKRKKQQEKCFWCLQPLNAYIHVDHIHPLYLGGSNGKGNLCIAHPHCNMKKGAKVYATYKQASKRRGEFKAMKRSENLKVMLQKHPNAKLSRKGRRALRIAKRIKPIV